MGFINIDIYDAFLIALGVILVAVSLTVNVYYLYSAIENREKRFEKLAVALFAFCSLTSFIYMLRTLLDTYFIVCM